MSETKTHAPETETSHNVHGQTTEEVDVDSPDIGTGSDYDLGRSAFFYVVFIFQIILFFMFLILVDYNDSATVSKASVNGTGRTPAEELDHFYPLYQDVHVMIFIGFGFLMTFLQKYGFSSVGYNFVIAAICIQWSIIINGLFHKYYENHIDTDPSVDHLQEKIKIGILDLIKGDFAAGAVLITFGALLGKTSPLQMVLIAIVELLFYALNELIGATLMGAVDMGGSMFVHTFGAYFGLAVSKVLTSSPGHGKPPRKYNSSIYKSDMFAMVGTLFLWMFWPSFNGALAEDAQQARVAINTVLALTASCFVAFMADVIFRKDHKFDMVSIQNATLAGGVAVGSSSDLVIQPWGALVVGAVAGLISVLGYVYISPMLSKIFFLDDTCGVHNLHGLPGIIGGLGGIISSVTASDSIYGQDISTVFAARGPCPEGVDKAMAKIPCGRSAAEQAEWQAYALITTLIIAVVGGLLTGLVVKAPFLVPNKKGETDRCTGFGNNGDDRLWYQDRHYWEQPEEEEDHDHHE